MLSLPSSTRVYVSRHPCDMRCSFEKLSSLVSQVLDRDPLSGHLFVFLNRVRTHVKILWWDRTGYAIFYKRLERGTFTTPVSEEIEYRELMCMLEGLEISQLRKKKRFSLQKDAAVSQVV